MNPPLLFGGIDPSGSEKKASGVALLDTERRLVEVKRLKRDDEIVAFFATHADRIRFIGLDGICKLPEGLGRCCFEGKVRRKEESPCACRQVDARLGRTAERALRKLGIQCYMTTRRAFARSWILRSLDMYERLINEGFNLLEIYPYATKVRLFGRNLPRKTTLAGRKALQGALGQCGLGLASHERTLSHDELDAILSAYTALLHHEGNTEALGEERDGPIIIPAAA